MSTSGIPLYFYGTDYAAFVLSDVLLTDVVKAVMKMALRCIFGLLIGTLGIGLIIARRMRRQFIDPINRIAAAATHYLEDRRKGITSGEHFNAIGIKTNDEIENLCDVMSQMEKGLNEYEANITRITAEKERISTELSLAARIQSDALP
jgi:sigma-B regulation protein RsbU (phosphoserine phosphatase)